LNAKARFWISSRARCHGELLPRESARRVKPVLFLFAFLLVIVQVAMTAGPLRSQETAIVEVEVSGNKAVDKSLIESSFGVHPGRPFSADRIRSGVKRLYSLGLFSDIRVFVTQLEDGVKVEVAVRERPKIAKIGYVGNKKLSEDKLKEERAILVGQLYSERLAFNEARRIESLYEKNGYPLAKVQWSVTERGEGGDVVLVFDIDEGARVKVKRISFTGNKLVSEKTLKKKMKTKEDSWFRSGSFHQDKFEEDLKRLKQFYLKEGFREARILDHKIDFSPDRKKMFITIDVHEGERYVFGNHTWEGNEVLSDSLLDAAVRFKAGEVFNAEKLSATEGAIYAEYSERGYLYLLVDPEESFRGDTVDVTFRITEGQPSHVNDVLVEGNLKTKEKVIRRELSILPGNLFRRSALMRSQRDVFILGFFEDVQVDYRPASSDTAPDIDIVFKVKEKQLGTANMGFGYNSQVGLTGLLELGHTNLFGNGQRLNLRYERGERRTNAEVAFTDPWILDTRTSFGFNLHDLEERIDYYDQARSGGTVQMGRRVRWLDYTSVYWTFRLEDMAFKNFSSSYRGGLSEAKWPVRTVSNQFTLVRNSTDNPFHPTSGSRTSFTTEWAGGLAGGDVDFHKHVFDNRNYLPLFRSLALMTRERVGFVGSYSAREAVPDYERFRLGGTTYNYLRGYRDYSVVPRGNLAWVGGKIMLTFTAECQFPIVSPLHGLLFFDAGGVWNGVHDFDLSDLSKGAGVGVRMEVPMLGTIGLDYGYGFDRLDGPQWEAHFVVGPGF